MAHVDLGHNDGAKEYAVDWLVGLGAAGAAGSAVSGVAAVGNAVTSSSATTGSTFGAAAGLTSGVGMGGLAATNLVATSAATTAQAAAKAAEVNSAVWAGAASQSAFLQPQADAAATAAATAQADANAAAAKAKASKWVTPILDAANVIHMSLNLLNGFGGPNNGGSLSSAADSLDKAVLNLELAANTSGWAGDAEASYSAANTAQQERVKGMAGIDRDFKTALTTQADQVLKLREVFGYVTGSFAIWKPILGALSAQGEPQKAASLITQGVVGAALVATDISHQAIHRQKAIANGAAIQAIATRYQNL